MSVSGFYSFRLVAELLGRPRRCDFAFIQEQKPVRTDIKYHTVLQGCMQNFPDWAITKWTTTIINTRWEATQKVMVAKFTRLTHTAPNGREMYHLQFSLQAAGPETFGYTLAYVAQTCVIWLCSWFLVQGSSNLMPHFLTMISLSGDKDLARRSLDHNWSFLLPQ
jgi:hypothetical protein